jgi:hypothetical protein
MRSERMQITVDLSDEQSQRLLERSRELSIQPEELVGVAVNDLLGEPDDRFRRIVDRVLEKNRELYKRLS